MNVCASNLIFLVLLMHGKCRAGLSDHLIKLLIQLLPDYLTQCKFSASWSSHGNVNNGNGCNQWFAILTPIYSACEDMRILKNWTIHFYSISFSFSKRVYNEILLHSFLHAGLSEQTPTWEPSQRSVWWSLSSERLRTPIPAKTFSPGGFFFQCKDTESVHSSSSLSPRWF